MIDPDPIGTLDFDLNDNEKEFLLQCGRVGALEFLDNQSPGYHSAVERLDELRTSISERCKIRRSRKRFKKSVIGLLLFAFALAVPLFGWKLFWGLVYWFIGFVS